MVAKPSKMWIEFRSRATALSVEPDTASRALHSHLAGVSTLPVPTLPLPPPAPCPLQTLVFKLGLAKSIHHARVLIRQRHIRVGKQIVNIPSFMVRVDSQVRQPGNSSQARPGLAWPGLLGAGAGGRGKSGARGGSAGRGRLLSAAGWLAGWQACCWIGRSWTWHWAWRLTAVFSPSNPHPAPNQCFPR